MALVLPTRGEHLPGGGESFQSHSGHLYAYVSQCFFWYITLLPLWVKNASFTLKISLPSRLAHVCPQVAQRPSPTNVCTVVSILRSWIKPTLTPYLWPGATWHKADPTSEQPEQQHFPAWTWNIIKPSTYRSLTVWPQLFYKKPRTSNHVKRASDSITWSFRRPSPGRQTEVPTQTPVL